MLDSRPRPLLPKSITLVVPATLEPQLAPTPYEWGEHFPIIKRLYADERRRLKYVVAYMEREYDFKAT